jgi:hypothetical protein
VSEGGGMIGRRLAHYGVLHFIAMECVAGRTLAALLRAGRLPAV